MNAHAFRHSLREQVQTFCAAIMLLTRVPVGAFYRHRAELSAGSGVYFPLLGFFVGLAGAGAAWLGLSFFPTTPPIPLSKPRPLAPTGAFSQNGLGDRAPGPVRG